MMNSSAPEPAETSPVAVAPGVSPILKLITLALVAAILVMGYRLVRLAFLSDDRPARTEIERRLFKARSEIEQNPRAADPYVKLATTLATMGDYEAANEQLSKAKKVEPTFFRAYYLAALNYEKMGDLSSAEKELLAAGSIVRRRLPGGSWEPIHFRLGQVYIKTRQWNKAVQQLTAAFQLRNSGADTLFFLGRAYEGQGRTGKAIDSYKRALEFDPANADAKRALARLKR